MITVISSRTKTDNCENNSCMILYDMQRCLINHHNYFDLSLILTVMLTVDADTDPIEDRILERFEASIVLKESEDETAIAESPPSSSRLNRFEGSKMSDCCFLPSPPRKCW